MTMVKTREEIEAKYRRLKADSKAASLERRAATLEQYAEDREARAAAWYVGGSTAFYRSLATAEGYRVEANELRARAAQLRRNNA